MNSDYEEGERRASIPTPSARPSIHCENIQNMVRYGLNTSKDRAKKANSPGQHGTDEVDNVMSKFSYEVSPQTIKKSLLVRSNSCSNDEETSDNSSGETEEEPNDSLFLNRSHQNYEHQQRSPSYPRKLSVAEPMVVGRTKRKTESNKLIYILLTLVIGILAAYLNILPLLQQYSHDKPMPTVNYNEMFENNLLLLQEKYNIDANTILQLKTGILTIFSRMDTGSFMFLYNSKTHNFDSSQFEKFINDVAYAAAKFLRNDISSIKESIVQSSDLDMQEHSELINRYRDDVDKSGVLLVKEVDSVPSDLAMAFHYYCDEYNPLVKKSAIFFTLNLANCSGNVSDKKSTYDLIEKCLSRKWNTIPPENMKPLLTRMIDIVIDVTSVF